MVKCQKYKMTQLYPVSELVYSILKRGTEERKQNTICVGYIFFAFFIFFIFRAALRCFLDLEIEIQLV